MPLRFVRSKISGVTPAPDALQVAITTTAFAGDLISTLQFPPATAAISVLLLIFETIQVSLIGCDRLARRAAQILVDIDNQMRGRWDSAPELLIQNLQKFEETLKLVHEFMRRLADSKWSDRFLRKNSIEDALCEYTRLMEEAAQSFQLTTLIDLHYTVSTLARKIDTSTDDQTSNETCVGVLPPYKKKESQDECTQKPGGSQSCVTFDAAVSVSDFTTLPMDTLAPSQASAPMTEIATCGVQDLLNDHYLPEELSCLTLGDDHGFRRYHQSEVMLRGRSRLQDSWWRGAMEVQVQGQPVLIKKYDDPKDHAYRQWVRDVRMLQNLYHPNLPHLLGFSDDKAQTPFILLSNGEWTQTSEALVRETLRTASLATCMELMLRFLKVHQDTAMYVQRQLNLTEGQVQDFFEASRYRVDSRKTLVVGLPPPREGQWCTGRNHGLAHTLLDACLHMLPNKGRVTYSHDKGDAEVTEDMQKKNNHLVTLARALLPSGSESPELPPKLQELIEDNDFDTPCLTLRQVRDLTFQAGGHDHSWYERHVPADKFFVGDIGYILPGTGWDSFVRLRNVFEDDMGVFKTSMKTKGEHWCWENMPIRRQPLQGFDMPMNIAGWPVAVPPHKQIDVVVVHEAFVSVVKDAWQYLLRTGKKLAGEAGIEPEDLILVTHAGTHQDFYIKDIRPQLFGMNQNRQLVDLRFNANPSHRQQMHGFHQPPHFN
ncbi:hypothetical protein PAXRUDRAFT_764104 [Paxillus rubicundulus Ve08.2h10]|uniref:Protein kinase domain-containing protein n=1 Tax=Paxillus rubicundulus Ve08.2h10 TaxID=930991 RepID=A0A0D0CDW0_9AGAM|nr:hypothetical protein PAXRUDRAFT_764104 [Paxillus rubicundulus Ve08.2h10]